MPCKECITLLIFSDCKNGVHFCDYTNGVPFCDYKNGVPFGDYKNGVPFVLHLRYAIEHAHVLWYMLLQYK